MINPKRENVRTMIVSSLLLTVPAYQRAYEWGNNEVGEFWDDLSSYSAGDDDFFLGTLIFNVNQINQEISIVDGQQRFDVKTRTLLIGSLLTKMMLMTLKKRKKKK